MPTEREAWDKWADAMVAGNPQVPSGTTFSWEASPEFDVWQQTALDPKGPTEAEIIQKFISGGYGAVGSNAARQAALGDLAQHFKNTGVDAATAVTMAVKAFDASASVQGAIINAGNKPPLVGGTGRSGRGFPGLGGAGAGSAGAGSLGLGEQSFANQRDKWIELERTGEGRGDLLDEAIRSQYPHASNPFQAFLGRQGDRLFNQYALGSAFGPSHAGDTPINTFRDYLRGGAQGDRLSQSAMGGMLGQIGQALSNPDTSGLSQQMANWLPFFEQGVNQFNAALQSSLGGVAGAAQPYFERKAGSSFADYGVNNPETGGWLNYWLGRDKRFF